MTAKDKKTVDGEIGTMLGFFVVGDGVAWDDDVFERDVFVDVLVVGLVIVEEKSER